MKNVVFALIVFILAIYLILLMSRPKGYRHAIFRGAPTKVVLKVVDDTGKVVSGAHIEAIFNNYIREPKIRKGLTDKNGEFVAQHKSTGEIDYFITLPSHKDKKGVSQLKSNCDFTHFSDQKLP